MDAQTDTVHEPTDTVQVRKTVKYNLMPILAQERALEQVLSRRRTLYNVALEKRKRALGTAGQVVVHHVVTGSRR